MRPVAYQLVFLNLWFFVLSTVSLTAAPNQEPAKTQLIPAQLEKNTLPAAGSQKTLLNVTRVGRYSILASSKQGTGIQLIDRMAGPGPIEGKAGEQDGRYDAFLERGQYQVVTHGHKQAAGTVRVDLRAFEERNLPQPPQLIELKPVEEQLHDFEQYSYWIDIKQREVVLLEAAGRSLADLRLWKGGNWLMDVSPSTEIITPKTGQPLLACHIHAELDPGLYLLTAYGGPAQPWAEESKSHPFYLRRGIQRLGLAGRRRFVVGPFGYDRYLVPGQATYFRMELPEARTAQLRVGWFRSEMPFAPDGSTSEISKKSVTPAVAMNVEGRTNQDHIVTVTAEAGQPYILQQFEMKYLYSFEGDRDYWISTIHSGFAADSVDATAVLAGRPRSAEGRTELYRAQVVDVGAKEYWHRRINLLDDATIFVHIHDSGEYQLSCQGVEAQYRFEPLPISRPGDYQAPEFKPCGANWDLNPGYYQVWIKPSKKGIADLLLRPTGMLNSILNSVGWGRSVPITPSRGSTRFSRVTLNPNYSYMLLVNRQPEVSAGMILRALPADLADPLYVVQEPAESISIPTQVKEPAVLRAETEDGVLLEMSVDGGPWQTAVQLDTAVHTVSVRHNMRVAVRYTLAASPVRLSAQTPLPSMSQEALDALPKFPVIDESTPRFGDLEKVQTATYLLKADKPALYQLQSTGLLATAGNLRSRTNPSFVRKSQNGIGRNFNLQQYLREGDYQISVQSEGESAGHYGLELARTAIRNGGFLTSRVPARATLEPGQSIAYYFQITTPGSFRLRALGEGRTFHCRLEDRDGWPLLAPDIEADVSRYFAAGQYRLVILPEMTTARVVAQIEPVSRQRRFKGHGPHNLRLAERVNHIWMEPEEGSARIPDQWEFTAPAPMTVRIELSNEMEGTLLRLDDAGNTSRIAKVVPSRQFNEEISMGRYRLEVVAFRRNNRLPYHLSFAPAELVSGVRREVTVPVRIPLSVGKTSVVEVNSFGSDDVQARLLNSDGRLVAANDDRPDDWNFMIAGVLAPGRYVLEVDPAGKEKAATTISMITPTEEPQATLALPAQLRPVLKEAIQLYPLPAIERPVLLVAAVDSSENVGLAAEALEGDVWHVLAAGSTKSPRIEIPLGGEDSAAHTSYRLRLWSLDRREMRVGLRVDAIIPTSITEGELEKGIPVPSPKQDFFAFLVKLDHPGLFQVDDEFESVCWSGGLREPCTSATEKLIEAWRSEIWVAGVVRPSEVPRLFRAHRLVLSAGSDSVQFPMRDQGNVYCDLAPNGTNPVLLLASSQEGQPVAQLLERGSGRTSDFANNIAIVPRGSASVLINARSPQVSVWAGAPAGGGINVRIHSYHFPPVQALSSASLGDGGLEGIRAYGFALGAGAKRLNLAIGSSTVAILSNATGTESVHWQGGEPFYTSIETDAERLMLLHLRPEEDRYAVEVIPLPSAKALQEAKVYPGHSYEQNHSRPGISRLQVNVPLKDAGADFVLHIRGAAGPATFLGSDGFVRRGADFAVPGGSGTLEFLHGSGLLLCWLEKQGEGVQGLWPSIPNPSNVRMAMLPSIHELKSAAEAFQIETEKPVLLHARMASPSVSFLDRPSGTPEVEIHPAGTSMDAYLPAGISKLYLRSIGGSSSSLFQNADAGNRLTGMVEFTKSPITAIGEGLGPEILLAPGDSRLFSFEVKKDGPVGVAVRASSDVVETELLTSSGKPLGTGTVQKLDLKQGIYLLKLRSPAQGTPVIARPAVVGIVQPSTGPPEDVIRQYLRSEDTAPPFTSTRQQAIYAEESAEEEPEEEDPQQVDEDE